MFLRGVADYDIISFMGIHCCFASTGVMVCIGYVLCIHTVWGVIVIRG